MPTNVNASPGVMVGDTGAHPAPLRHLVSKSAMWFGVLGAPAAWSAQLLISYAVAAHSCFPRLAPFTQPEFGPQKLTTTLVTLSAAGLVVALFSLMLSVRNWKATVKEGGGSTHNALDIGEGRTRFMSMGGILISSVFVLGVCAQAVMIFSLKACTQ
jgi:hypothetical protein